MPSDSAPARPKILIIRGGAIGDFILTLPALGLLREAFPSARLEIIGYRNVAVLAEGRFYADSVRSIEYGPMAGFFARGGTLDSELCEYFSGFQQVVSYLFDPDGIFEANVRRAGVKNFLSAYAKIDDETHAARQLARPLEGLALYLDDAAAKVHPSPADRAAAERFWTGAEGAWRAIHPGSGGARKNWPIGRWQELVGRLLENGERLLVVGGEADRVAVETLNAAHPGRPRLACDLPLPELAAILERCTGFLGHDSGVSHLAAAVGVPCVLLFGPTDPHVWAPANAHVQVIQAPEGDLQRLAVDAVWAAVQRDL